MYNNGCPVCGGLGRVLAFGFVGDPVPIRCPECAGLAITPACADDHRAAPRTEQDAPGATDPAPIENHERCVENQA